jgi:thiol-disulfide isomerase/thioredoxin
MRRRVLYENVGFVLIGILVLAYSVYTRNAEIAKMEVYYYYSPDCPNCQSVRPFVDELKEELTKKKIKFVELNVKETHLWNPIYRWLAQKIISTIKTDFIPIPTAAVRFRGRFHTAFGKEEVLYLNDFFHQYAGTRLLTAKLNKLSFSMSECLDCHKARKIPPPSTFNCTFCCHRSK